MPRSVNCLSMLQTGRAASVQSSSFVHCVVQRHETAGPPRGQQRHASPRGPQKSMASD